MIISKAPFRTSFFGGGTDYKEYYSEYGGMVVGAAINKYGIVLGRELPNIFPFKNKIVYSEIETIDDCESIRHCVFREALRMTGMCSAGLEIAYFADMPDKTGIGSSSSFSAALLSCLYAMKGIRKNQLELTNDVIHLEREILGESGGIQDQIWAVYGGFNVIRINRKGVYTVEPICVDSWFTQELEKHLILVFTGFSRKSSDIASVYKGNLSTSENMREIERLANEGLASLYDYDIERFGSLLDESWGYKRSIHPNITNPDIDKLYEEMMLAGAYGGKLIGAGSGGFLLMCIPPSRQYAIKDIVPSSSWWTTLRFSKFGAVTSYN